MLVGLLPLFSLSFSLSWGVVVVWWCCYTYLCFSHAMHIPSIIHCALFFGRQICESESFIYGDDV